MDLQQAQVEKSIALAIGNAVTRLPLLNERDRMAVVLEYKEWLADKTVQDEVMVLREL